MNRAALEEQFSMAKENVRWDIEQVRKQREKVEWLERGGHDAAQARKVLDTAEDLLLLHMADREHLSKELEGVQKEGPPRDLEVVLAGSAQGNVVGLWVSSR